MTNNEIIEKLRNALVESETKRNKLISENRRLKKMLAKNKHELETYNELRNDYA